ncbi:HEAT repeat domain-containing protein [Desulfoluna sp.]|uniref:HEAT repeat domain-containing protein n=1 Tax=Desulfoluna sp. TaxID=2045199 RepID=UPI0026159B4B|nr:HEAT repeat domain-containing protein [Desulfoluna sp.]
MNISDRRPNLKLERKTRCHNGLHGAGGNSTHSWSTSAWLGRCCPVRQPMKWSRFVPSSSLPLLFIIFTAMLYMTSGCTGGSNASLLVPGEFGVSQTERSALFQQLDRFEPGERKRAAKKLGKVGPVTNRYISSLLHVIESSSHSERVAAVNKIGECGTHMAETTDVLCRSLQDTNPKVRAASARSLKQIAKKLSPAVQPLEQIKATPGGDKDTDHQKLITSAEKASGVLLTQITKIERALAIFSGKSSPLIAQGIADEKKTEEMVSLAENPIQTEESHPDSEIDAGGVGIPLNPYYHSSLSPELRREIDELDGFSTRKRRGAAHTIERMCLEHLRPIPDHVSLLKNQRSETPIETLAFDMEVAVSALCRSMQDVDYEVRIHSATTLGTIAGAFAVTVAPLETAIEEVEQKLKSQEDMPDRMWNGLLLKTFKQSCENALKHVHWILGKSVTVLVGQRDIPSYEVRNAAAEAIKKINSGLIASGATPEKTKKKKPTEALEAPEVEAASLAYYEKERKMFLLMHDLEHPYVSIGRKAARELGAMGPEATAAVPALIKAIKNKSNWYPEYHYVIEESIRALGKIGPSAEGAIPVLMELLDEHHNTAIRGGAAISLGLISKDTETVVPKLIDLLNHAHATPVKAAVSEALGSFPSGPHSGICYRELLKVLEKSSGTVSLNAFKSLSLYEAKNRGIGLVTWAPLEGYVCGYQVLLKTKTGDFVTFIDTGMETVINLGQFPQYQEDTHQIKVMARRGIAVVDIPWSHVDVQKILTVAAASEKDPEVKTGKDKALALLKAGELLQDRVNEATPDIMVP